MNLSNSTPQQIPENTRSRFVGGVSSVQFSPGSAIGAGISPSYVHTPVLASQYLHYQIETAPSATGLLRA